MTWKYNLMTHLEKVDDNKNFSMARQIENNREV